MRLAPIIARLKLQCPLLGNRVAPASALSAVNDIGNDVPAVFAHPWTDKAPASDSLIVQQRVGSAFALQIAAQTAVDDDEPLEDVRDEIRAALLDWQGDYGEPIEYVEGGVLDINGRLIWWRDIYIVGNYIRG